MATRNRRSVFESLLRVAALGVLLWMIYGVGTAQPVISWVGGVTLLGGFVAGVHED